MMPSTLWSVICLGGFWGFVLATLGFIKKGFPARGVFDRAASLKWGGVLLFCFVVWVVGMAHA
jgi:hypothetical protein